jgi:hypothetical protein
VLARAFWLKRDSLVASVLMDGEFVAARRSGRAVMLARFHLAAAFAVKHQDLG